MYFNILVTFIVKEAGSWNLIFNLYIISKVTVES